MDRSDVIYLVAATYTQDDYGVLQADESRRKVYCNVTSVTATEFFEGGRNGLNPEYRFTLFAPDYQGETIIEYKGKRYGVYRTYLARTDTLELYAERKGGTNAEESNSGQSG